MSSRSAHIFSEIYRFFFSNGGLFRNILYYIYVVRLGSAEKVVRFLLYRPSVKKHLDSNGQDWTTFSSFTVNRLIPFFVGTQKQKVLVRFLEIWPVNGCNLKCDYCGAFSPLRKGFIPADETILWLETWSKKIVPLNLAISGGEPLLHPQLDMILDSARRCYPSSRLELITNGLLLTKTKPIVLESISRNKIQVLVSKHFDTPEFNEKFFAGIDVLKKNKIVHTIRRGDKHWFKYYQKNENGEPIPYNSDPLKAWNQCFAKNATNISDNKLFYCCILTNARNARNDGVIGSDWDMVLQHQPLDSDCTREEIVRYLYNGVIKECCLCSEMYEYIIPSEIPQQ